MNEQAPIQADKNTDDSQDITQKDVLMLIKESNLVLRSKNEKVRISETRVEALRRLGEYALADSLEEAHRAYADKVSKGQQ